MQNCKLGLVFFTAKVEATFPHSSGLFQHATLETCLLLIQLNAYKGQYIKYMLKGKKRKNMALLWFLLLKSKFIFAYSVCSFTTEKKFTFVFATLMCLIFLNLKKQIPQPNQEE